jgi:hypothetical protein
METESNVIIQETSVADAKKAAAKANRQAAMKRAQEARKVKKMIADSHKPIPEAPVVQVKDSEIVWFTEVDYNPQGKVASDYPAYYFDTKEIKEEIRVLSEQLDDGVFQGKRKREAETRLLQRKDRLDKIESGRPKLEGQVKDKVVKSMNDLGDRIRGTMFSYDSHWKQTADPHDVADRMVNPCVEIKDECVASFARQRGMRIVDGKINQNDASVIFKTMCKLVGEPSDTDRLRPLKAHGTTI